MSKTITFGKGIVTFHNDDGDQVGPEYPCSDFTLTIEDPEPAPAKSKIKWYVGASVDKDGKIANWTADAKGGLKPCRNIR
jgi:hypothetical protein